MDIPRHDHFKMRRLLFGNFDFEHQLAAGQRLPSSSLLQRINAELAAAWIAVSEPDDLVWTPQEIRDSWFSDALEAAGLHRPQIVWSSGQTDTLLTSDGKPISGNIELVPWGWSQQMFDWGKRHGCICTAPPLDVVGTANCRLFAHELETRWDCGLAGATAVQKFDELAKTICRLATSQRGWVMKARFGMSGRERLSGRGMQLTEQAAGWAQRRLRDDGSLIIEPWVERVDEAGLQFMIPRRGQPNLLGVTPLLTNRWGTYRGNRFSADGREAAGWQEAINIGLAAAELLQQRGYFGPLGIDAMSYRDACGTIRLRPLQDINARYTMGMLSLGFRRLLEKGEVGSWLHFRIPAEEGRIPAEEGCILAEEGTSAQQWIDQHRRILPSGCRIVPTSPAMVGARRCELGTAVLIAPSPDVREVCEAKFLAALGLAEASFVSLPPS